MSHSTTWGPTVRAELMRDVREEGDLGAVEPREVRSPLGFLLEGTYAPVSLKLDVLVAYVIAAGAAWLWTAPGRSVAAPEGSSGWL